MSQIELYGTAGDDLFKRSEIHPTYASTSGYLYYAGDGDDTIISDFYSLSYPAYDGLYGENGDDRFWVSTIGASNCNVAIQGGRGFDIASSVMDLYSLTDKRGTDYFADTGGAIGYTELLLQPKESASDPLGMKVYDDVEIIALKIQGTRYFWLTEDIAKNQLTPVSQEEAFRRGRENQDWFYGDEIAPVPPSTPDLVASSDTGSSNSDNIT